VPVSHEEKSCEVFKSIIGGKVMKENYNSGEVADRLSVQQSGAEGRGVVSVIKGSTTTMSKCSW